jgi:hypothetical protein
MIKNDKNMLDNFIRKIRKEFYDLKLENRMIKIRLDRSYEMFASARRVNANIKYQTPISKHKNDIYNIKRIIGHFEKQGLISNKEELLLEAKSRLIDLTTITNRKINDLPTEKMVDALEKEEIRESKDSYVRDKKYLKTNYTSEEYAFEAMINVMLVNYKLDYHLAINLAKSLFVTNNKEKQFISDEELNRRLNELNNSKEDYLLRYPDKYAGKSKSFKDTIRSLFDENFHMTILSLPVLGIVLFSIIPLVFSILVAFTNYSDNHIPPQQLFTWNGLENFKTIFFPNPDSIFASLPNALAKTV